MKFFVQTILFGWMKSSFFKVSLGRKKKTDPHGLHMPPFIRWASISCPFWGTLYPQLAQAGKMWCRGLHAPRPLLTGAPWAVRFGFIAQLANIKDGICPLVFPELPSGA